MSSFAEIWCIPLDVGETHLAVARELLDAHEIGQAKTYRFEKHFRHFIARRAARRLILSSYTGIAPERLLFRVSEYGKPSLEAAPPLLFSASHSGELALLALAEGATQTGQIGVDVEQIRSLKDSLLLAEHYGSPSECVSVRSALPEQRDAFFLRYWTVKEAWLKATGTGLIDDLASLRITLQSDAYATISSRNSGVERQVALFFPADGYVAALVGSDRPFAPLLRMFHWPAAIHRAGMLKSR